MQVVVLDKLDYCASLRNLDDVAHLPNLKVCFVNYRTNLSDATALTPPWIQFVKGDITSTDFVLHLLKEEAIDTILNFAAQVTSVANLLYTA